MTTSFHIVNFVFTPTHLFQNLQYDNSLNQVNGAIRSQHLFNIENFTMKSTIYHNKFSFKTHKH